MLTLILYGSETQQGIPLMLTLRLDAADEDKGFEG